MQNHTIALNKFDPRTTKKVLIHDGRFHADDTMFAALAVVAAEKCKNKIEIQRVGQLPSEYDSTIVAGDLGFGVYDHHMSIDGTISIGSLNNTEDYLAAACDLLYKDVKNVLFPGESETKNVFEAFIDIIAHCDNTPDNNTFSDSVNLLTPTEDSEMDTMAMKAIDYCKAVINGFISAHDKEVKGKIWAVPRVCSGILPGLVEKRDSRYWKASNQIKKKYKYVSFNDKQDIKLRSMDTYSLACGALSQKQRQYWRDELERNDKIQTDEMARREKEEWPKAVQNMRYRTICINNYLPYGQYVKDLNALFVIMPSQRGGYTVTFLKTNTGKYRFNPDLLMNFEGCSFVANDKRFVFFDTKEQAIAAAHAAGKTVNDYLALNGFNAYRELYGGLQDEYSGDFYQDLISEDIALNIYAKEIVKDLNNLTVSDYRKLQIAVMNNPYLIHSFCMRFCNDGDTMQWKTDVAVAELNGLNKENLWTKNKNGSRWDMGLQSFIATPIGKEMTKKVFPKGTDSMKKNIIN
jgi:uncharacterized UPF0160 family protein